MPEVYGQQQSDAWLKARCGRITGSHIADVCAYLSRANGQGKKAGDPKAERDNYKMDLICERMSGYLQNHFDTPEMQWGRDHEDEARLYYEAVLNVETKPICFYVHDKFDFTGASADAMVGTEGILELKCPTPRVHIGYILAGKMPDDYVPQVAWELACTGRKFADFVSYDPRILDDEWRFFYRRVDRDSLEWEYTSYAGEKPQVISLTGERVIEYFTEQVLKFEAEINEALRGRKPVAPFPVEVKG